VFAGLRDHEAAKKILIPLQEHVQEETIRHNALLNLLDIAAKERDKKSFAHYRSELDGKISSPEMQVHYHLYLGKGYDGFWRPAAATEERHTALAIATAYGLHQLRTLVLDHMHYTDRPSASGNDTIL
jgi:hypothetical protein